MKAGRSLTDLAAEIERQAASRHDYLAPTPRLTFDVRHAIVEDREQSEVVIDGLNGVTLGITPYAHGQVASETGIPKPYYGRMLGLPGAHRLLAANVNHWLHAESRTRMVRTLDGRMRAFLSDRYRPLDYFDMARTVLPVLQESGSRIESAELTDTRLYIKAVLPSLETEIARPRQRGDVVQAGIVISNSEVGAGAVRVEPMLYILACLNGAIVPDSGMKRYHLGRQAEIDAVVRELLSNEARQADDRAFWLKVRDVVRGAFDRDVFARLVARASAAAEQRIESPHLDKVVEVTVRSLGLGEGKDTRDGLLQALISGGDLSQWGLSNAITTHSQVLESYETATEWERAGGRVLELAPTDWKAIATAN